MFIKFINCVLVKLFRVIESVGDGVLFCGFLVRWSFFCLEWFIFGWDLVGVFGVRNIEFGFLFFLFLFLLFLLFVFLCDLDICRKFCIFVCFVFCFFEFGVMKEMKIFFLGELLWLFWVVFELKFVMFFIVDILINGYKENL